MKKFIRKFREKKSAAVALFFLILIGFTGNSLGAADSFASELPPLPESGFVFDEDRLMTSQQVEFFNKLSAELQKKTGVVLAVALMDDIGYAEANSYAKRTREKWEIGGNVHNCILIFASMKQRRYNVNLGDSVSILLKETSVERLQQKYLVTAFQVQKYGEGIITLSYEIAQAVALHKGVSLDIDISALPKEEPMSPSGWIFIVLVFGSVAYGIWKSKGRHGKRNPGFCCENRGFEGGFRIQAFGKGNHSVR